MGKDLSENITVVISCTDTLSRELVKCLLKKNATVAVIAGSTQELISLSHFLSPDSSEKFLPFLTDPLDYIKCLDILAHLREMYGGIDLVVTGLVNFCPLVEFTHFEARDWQRLTEHNINFFFSNRLILNHLRDKTSLYLSFGKHNQQHTDNQNNITDLINSLRLEVTSIISAEFAGVKARYHHLFLDLEDMKVLGTGPPGKQAADYIMELYTHGGINNESSPKNLVFQYLTPSILLKNLLEK